jgi:hypothetical protein
MLSDQALSKDVTWFLKLHKDMAVLDDNDSIRFEGWWYDHTSNHAINGQYHSASRSVFPNTAEYLYFPPASGTYEIAVYVPLSAALTTQASYVIRVENHSLDTFHLNQLEEVGNLSVIGRTVLPAAEEVAIQVSNTEYPPKITQLAVDGIEFRYLGCVDTICPEISLFTDSVIQGNDSRMISNEVSYVYLVPAGTAEVIDSLKTAALASNLFYDDTLILPTSHLDTMVYCLYAVDLSGNISSADTLSVISGPTGYENILAEDLSIFPNPVSDILYIDTRRNINTLAVFNLLGEKIMEFRGSRNHLDVHALKSGIYFIRIRTENGSTCIKKFRKY